MEESVMGIGEPFIKIPKDINRRIWIIATAIATVAAAIVSGIQAKSGKTAILTNGTCMTWNKTLTGYSIANFQSFYIGPEFGDFANSLMSRNKWKGSLKIGTSPYVDVCSTNTSHFGLDQDFSPSRFWNWHFF